MTDDQENAIYSAYMGISVLQTMCCKVDLKAGEERCKGLLFELATAFPEVYQKCVLPMMLRKDTT